MALTMEALTNSKDGSKYLLNKVSTLKKLQIAASKPAIEVTRNGGSTTVHLSTGAYVTVVIPLVNMWKEIEGDDIDSDMVDGMDISVDSIKVKKDDAGTIEHYLVKLTVDGHKVTVTCFDTTLTVLVQASKSVLEPYCSRALFPHLEREIKNNKMKIKEYNHLVLAYDSAKPNTRRQHQKHLRGASALASSPRLRTLSSPGTPLEVQVAALHSPARREVAPPSLGLQLLEDVSLLEDESSVEIVTLQEEEVVVRSSTPAPADGGEVIVTTKSQILPELGWMANLDDTIDTPPSPAPSPPLLSLQQQVRSLELLPAPVEPERHVPAPVEQAMEHLIGLLDAAVPGSVSLEEPALEEEPGLKEAAQGGALPGLVRLQQPLIPTPVKAPSRKATSVDTESDEEVYNCLGGEKCALCGQKCRNVSSLQEHIIKTHCTQPHQMLDMLKVQQDILNTILVNQSTQKNTMDTIALTQKAVITDIKNLKRTATAPLLPVASPPLTTPQESLAPRKTPQDTSAPRGPADSPPNPPPAIQPATTTMADIVRQSMAEQTESPDVLHEQQPCASSILYMGDSIFRNVYMEKIEKQAAGAEVTVVKAYSSAYDSNKKNKFKSSNFTDLVPKELGKARHDALVMQASSVDLTNYKTETNKEKQRQIAQSSNANMLSVATTAAANHPELKKVLVFERAPRFDELEELNKFANKDLHDQWLQFDQEFKDKIVIGKHNLHPHGRFANVQRL